MRIRILAIAILVTAFLSSMASSVMAQQELNNAAIVKMLRAGLSAEIVASAINSQPGHYDISADSLIALKKAGATDPVISAILAKSSGAGSAPPPSSGGNSNSGFSAAGSSPAGSSPGGFNPTETSASGPSGAMGGAPALGVNGMPPGVDSVGVYVQDSTGNWVEVGAEVVNFKTGGALKHIGSVGIVKGDLNGHVAGFHSKLPLKFPANFLIYVPEGTSPGEYQLIRFRINSDSREFRALTGGVAHTAGGAVRDTAEFTTKKVAPRLYQVELSGDIGKGEYGFLPPTESTGKSITSSGKIYTFSFGE